MSKNPGFWFVLFLVTVVVLAVVADWWQDHPLAWGLGVGITFAVFIFLLIRFAIIRERVWAGLKGIAKALGSAFSEEERKRVSEGRYIPQRIKNQVVKRSGGKCEKPDCHYQYHPQYHHVDGHNDHNSRTNIAFLCPNCHKMADTGGYPRDVVRGWVRQAEVSFRNKVGG